MATGLMERYRWAGQPAPKLMYVDHGCCHQNGPTVVEKTFHESVEDGMITRLDSFHWIRRFDAALRSDHHSKYPLFKSALSGAIFAYYKDDPAFLAKAIRAGHHANMDLLSDAQVIQHHATSLDLKHFVRRITVGQAETYRHVQRAYDILKGSAGLVENGVHLFKEDGAIDEVWAGQQKHLECLQDPPGLKMYIHVKSITRNDITLPYYNTMRGTTQLEGFHHFLPEMIPDPRCAAVPFQVYLLSEIARWNADREAQSVKGQKGRKAEKQSVFAFSHQSPQ